MKVINETASETESTRIWGKKAMATGFVQIPSILFKRQRELGLDPVDMNIVAQLATYWWTKEKLPFPSKASLADALGVDQSTIRRRMAALEKRGYVRRIIRSGNANAQIANQYDMSGLIQRLQPHAEEVLAEREARKTSKGRRKLRAVVMAKGA
jgi:DNA-binding MarR family transcriptional regulator